MTYHNAITSGIGRAYTFAELGRLPASRVALLFTYLTTFKEVEKANAA